MTLFIYKPFNVSTINFDEIKDYFLKQFPKIKVEIKDNPLTEDLAIPFARIRVTDLNKVQPNEPLPAEINYEKRALNRELLPEGIMYDGFELQELLKNILKPKLSDIPIFLTNRLIGTFDDDKRYHARTNILGIPSIISITGIIEAPAKPREFYLLKTKLPFGILKEKFKGRFIDYDDKRLTEVLNAYMMQSIFYHLFGEAFCEDKNCRLYNSHWQEELINAHNKFCRKHENMTKSL